MGTKDEKERESSLKQLWSRGLDEEQAASLAKQLDNFTAEPDPGLRASLLAIPQTLRAPVPERTLYFGSVWRLAPIAAVLVLALGWGIREFGARAGAKAPD